MQQDMHPYDFGHLYRGDGVKRFIDESLERKGGKKSQVTVHFDWGKAERKTEQSERYEVKSIFRGQHVITCRIVKGRRV